MISIKKSYNVSDFEFKKKYNALDFEFKKTQHVSFSSEEYLQRIRL